MKNTYQKLLTQSQLLLSDFDVPAFKENYIVKMFINNNIKGLLHTSLTRLDQNPVFSYDITSRLSLLSYLENKRIDSSLLIKIFDSLHTLCESLEEYMLDIKYILLNPEYIFLEPENRDVFFCYCPVEENNKTYSFCLSLKLLLDFFIEKLDYNDPNCISTTYTLHQKCVTDTFIPSDLVEIPYSIMNKNSDSSGINKIPPNKNTDTVTDKTHSNNPSVNYQSDKTLKDDSFEFTSSIPDKKIESCQNESATDFDISISIFGMSPKASFIFIGIMSISAITLLLGVYLYFIEKNISKYMLIFIAVIAILLFCFSISYLRKEQKKQTLKNTKEELHIRNTVICKPELDITKEKKIPCAIGDTVLISTGKKSSTPHLVYSGTDFSQDVEITLFPFTIGKISDCVDCIIDNSMISRMHSRLYNKDGCYYIEDLNSSNGTFVNGSQIPPLSLIEINDGDFITFSHLTYIFRL